MSITDWKASQWAACHRRSIFLLAIILALGGIAAALRLPVALFPQVDFPRVVVSIEAGDRPADQMMIAVTRPVEQAVRSVQDVVGVRSTSSRGSAEISVNFTWGSDMISAMLQVESAINQVMAQLPAGTDFLVRRMDPTVFPVSAYSLTSDTQSLVQLRDLGEYSLVPLLTSINGVASVQTLGGETAEFRVEVTPEKLKALQISFADVASSLASNNVLRSVGRLQDHYKLFLLVADSRTRTLEEIGDTLIHTGGNGYIPLRDIAQVYLSTEPQWQRVTADGHDAVLLQVYQQPQGNTVQIVHEVQRRLQNIRNQLPPDVRITNWYDQSELINASARSVLDAIAIGVILAALVLLVFLRNFKITLIAILFVPAVLATTVLLLHQMHMSFNIMTLGGMAAAVGLIVDDAIVMIEHMVRRLRDRNKEFAITLRQAATEFTSPLAGSSAATIIIFAPLAFLSGVTGAFFKALSLTMASSLVISFLLAWLLIPLIAEQLLHPSDAQKEDLNPKFKALLNKYVWLMQKLMRQPIFLFLALLGLIALGAIGYSRVGTGFIPEMDEGGFILDYRAADGTALEETDRMLRQVEAIIQANPAVQTYSRRTGLQLGGGLTEANEGDMFVRLKPFPRAPISEVMDEIRSQIETNVPGLEIELILLMEDLIGDLTAVPQPIEIKLFSDDYQALVETAPRVASAIGNISGVVDVSDGIVLAGDAVNIIVDREKAAMEGLDPAQVTAQIRTWFEGDVSAEVQQNIKMLNIRLWTPERLRRDLSLINEAELLTPDGHIVPFRHVGHIEKDPGQPQIVRDNLKRMVAVTARISGRDMGSTIRDVKKILENIPELQTSIYYELGGLYQQQQNAFRGLITVFAAALALIFVLLVYLYEDLAMALSILSAPLLASASVFVGLWLSGIDLNITAMMGMTMIIGIVTEVSIFYFSEYLDLRNQGVERDQALIDAGVNRFRPILMTTLAAILALLPLALAIGQGSSMQQPLAVAIVSGLMVQLPLVLIALPKIYQLLTRTVDKLNR